MHVLIVDDSECDAELMAYCLDGLASVSIAATVAEALALIEVRRPDVVVSDLHLQDGTAGGLELLRAIKANVALAPIPVIIVTASYPRFDPPAVSLEAGADDHLVKPQGLSEFRKAIEDAIRAATRRRGIA